MRTHTLRGLTGSLVILVLAACTPDSTPFSPEAALSPRDVVQAPDTSHYYLYLGEPVYLVPETSRFVVNVEEHDAVDVLHDVLGPLGLSVNEERPLFQMPNHITVSITGPRGASHNVLGALRAEPRIVFAAPVYRLAGDRQEIVLINQFDVHFRDGTSEDVIDEILQSIDATLLRSPMPDSAFFAYRLKYPPGVEPLHMARELERHNASVEWVSVDMISGFRPSYVPSDPYYSQQFYLKNPITFGGTRVDINIESAWDLTLGSDSIRISVIDDGIDIFQGNPGGDVTSAQWSNGLGVDQFWPTAPSGESVFFPCCNDVHGTSIAGILWAGHNNGVGIAGIAPHSKLAAARIFRRTYPPESISSPFMQVVSNNKIADAINWSWGPAGSAIINNSWGGGSPSAAITAAINNALTSGRGGLGSVVVFSAGNPSNRDFGIIGPVGYPATLAATTNVISVGAIDRFGSPANYTPNGAITLVAPSGRYTGACLGEIVTTDRWGSPGCNDGPTGNIHFTTTFSGTSAAAPQVAGVAALMLTRYPGLTAGQVKARFQASADSWGPATTFGSGKLNARAAIF